MRTSVICVGVLGGLFSYSNVGLAESHVFGESREMEQDQERPVIDGHRITELLKDGHIPAPLDHGPEYLDRRDLAPEPIGRRGASYHHPRGHNKNHPPYQWYRADYGELYGFYKSSYELKEWAYNYGHQDLGYFADWLYESVKKHTNRTYYKHHYNNRHYEWKPRYYSSWDYYATRGDHNYYYFYYSRRIYFQVLREATKYVSHHGYGGNITNTDTS